MGRRASVNRDQPPEPVPQVRPSLSAWTPGTASADNGGGFTRPCSAGAAMSTTNVPVTITPEASEHVARLGLRKELGQMLDHVCQTMPGLKSILVRFQPAHDLDI